MKISVVIPLFNNKITVRRALESVFNQTYQPEEIIVVNDGSTDGSALVVSNINHPLVRIINQSNQGVSAARNRGIQEATREWIAFLDADDKWLEDHLMVFKSLSEKYPLCPLLGGSYLMKDFMGNHEKINLNKLSFKNAEGILNNYFIVAACSHPPIHSSSVAIKRSAIQSIGGFPIGIKSGEDLLTWAKLAVRYEIAYSVRPISIFVLDPAHSYEKKPNRIPQAPDIVGNELAKLAKRNKNIPGIRNYVAHWFKMRASIFMRLGMKKEAFKEVLSSLKYNPFNIRLYIYILLLFVPASSINFVFRKVGRA